MDNVQFKEQEESIDLKRVIWKYLRKWPWIIACVLISLVLAYLYLRYTPLQYQSKTTLKFDKKDNRGALASALSDLENLGMGLGNADELKGEAAVITSRPLLMQVVDNLNLSVRYFNVGKVKETEAYEDFPVSAKILSLKNDKAFRSITYEIQLKNGNRFVLSNEKSKDIGGTFGVPVKTRFGTIQIDRNPGVRLISEEIKIMFSSPISEVKRLERQVNVSIPDNKAMLIDVSLVGMVPEKSEAILNEITKQYNLDGMRDKSIQAQNTQNFIDQRLEVITRDLSGVENQKEDFQTKNRIVDIEAQAQLALKNTTDNTKSLLQQQAQLELLNSLASEANRSGDKLMPSNLGVGLSLEQAIAKYNEVIINRSKTLKQATQENPYVIELNKEAASLKNIVKQNIAEQQAAVRASISQINSQISMDRGVISKIPEQSKVYRGIERQQSLKEQLFLFLLQKREENAINLTVNAPKAKIVNPAYTLDAPVSPKKNIIYLGALIIGLLVPIGIFYLIFLLDDKIYNKDDIKNKSKLSTLAEIPALDDNNQLVGKNDFSELAESFRILVSNMKFLLPKKETGKTILVTSSVKGEGKTLVSVNLALTLGTAKHKTLLIGADIRNPQFKRYGKYEKNVGLTDYLHDFALDAKAIIDVTEVNPDCDIIYTGSIPPNPQELLSNGRFQQLIDEVRADYEYIVIDSAPLMLVSDTLSLSDTADATLYIVRSGVSKKVLIDFANQITNENKIHNVSFVLNDVAKNVRGYGYYGYGYNYGYGYGYGKSEKKKSWIGQWFKK